MPREKQNMAKSADEKRKFTAQADQNLPLLTHTSLAGSCMSA
jgi:hypothetical protein